MSYTTGLLTAIEGGEYPSAGLGNLRPRTFGNTRKLARVLQAWSVGYRLRRSVVTVMVT